VTTTSRSVVCRFSDHAKTLPTVCCRSMTVIDTVALLRYRKYHDTLSGSPGWLYRHCSVELCRLVLNTCFPVGLFRRVQFAISSSRDTIRRPIRYDIIRVFTATGRSAADMQMGSMMTVYAMRSLFNYLYLDHRAISAYTLRSRVSFSLAGRRGGHSAIY